MASIKSRRLRKKLYLDEFSVLGFEFSFDLNVDDEEGFNSLLDELIGFIEDRELSMGGGGNTKSFSALICSEHRYGSATNQDRDALTSWLQSKPSISNIVVEQLVDANYGI